MDKKQVVAHGASWSTLAVLIGGLQSGYINLPQDDQKIDDLHRELVELRLYVFDERIYQLSVQENPTQTDLATIERIKRHREDYLKKIKNN